jgi:hypothetical protein
MGLRIPLLTLGVGAIAPFGSSMSDSPELYQIFFWLFALLVVFAVAFWPTLGRGPRTELRRERRGWVDRIDFRRALRARSIAEGAALSRDLRD